MFSIQKASHKGSNCDGPVTMIKRWETWFPFFPGYNLELGHLRMGDFMKYTMYCTTIGAVVIMVQALPPQRYSEVMDLIVVLRNWLFNDRNVMYMMSMD